MVCLYTGFADVLLEMKKKPDPKLVQRDLHRPRRARRQAAAVDLGLRASRACWPTTTRWSSSPASLTDPLPRKQPWLPLHEHCLFKNGIHLGEMFYFSELARWLRAHKRNRFLFTAPPLRLPGAVGSPATPIATV